jgi:methylmalonyl-CoA epimerase
MRRTVSAPTIDHLGWAVRSIDSARPHFEAGLGLDMQSDERFPDVRVAFFGIGPSRVELLEPLAAESDLSRFIARRGEGLHHLALRVDDVAAALEEAPSHGFRLIDKAPRPGARGTLVGVVDPQREDGVLVQYVQAPMTA